jgi:pyridoxine 4-dehydrogenase
VQSLCTRLNEEAFYSITFLAASVAKEQNASVYQVAIAWLLHRSPVMLPIPGTSSVAHLEENVAAEKLQLTPAEMKALDSA